MVKAIVFILVSVLIFNGEVSAQKNCALTVDTVKILLDINLDSFLNVLDSEKFLSFTDKKNIPAFIKEELDCLTEDNFSLANPKEDYRCCCTSSLKLPSRKLLFFSISKSMFITTYLTGGVGVSTHILMGRFSGKTITDIWSGYSFKEFKSKIEVSKYIKQKRNQLRGLHLGCVSI